LLCCCLRLNVVCFVADWWMVGGCLVDVPRFVVYGLVAQLMFCGCFVDPWWLCSGCLVYV